jgi:hypothetical protein
MIAARSAVYVERARRIGLDAVWISAAALVFLLVGNVVCALLLHQFPAWSESPAERITREYNERFYARQANEVTRWLALDNAAELQAFFVENTAHAQAANVYEDFTMFRPAPWSGRFFNFATTGYRSVKDQGPWPPSSDFFNVFVFGGSTTMGIGPDWATIPSYLQQQLDAWRFVGKRIKVYNFGRGAYFSTQERILFQQLLTQVGKPDAVVFIDGLNDLFSLDGRPSEWTRFDQAFAGTVQSLPSSPAFLKGTALYRMAQILSDKLFGSAQPELPIYKAEKTPSRALEAALDRYIENTRQVAGIATAEHIRSLFVWQPVPGYGYDLSYHMMLNPVFGLGGHERSAQGYPLMAKRMASGELSANFLWLGDMQRNRTTALYMDAVHYTAPFSNDIAHEIAGRFVKDWELTAATE